MHVKMTAFIINKQWKSIYGERGLISIFHKVSEQKLLYNILYPSKRLNPKTEKTFKCGTEWEGI